MTTRRARPWGWAVVLVTLLWWDVGAVSSRRRQVAGGKWPAVDAVSLPAPEWPPCASCRVPGLAETLERRPLGSEGEQSIVLMRGEGFVRTDAYAASDSLFEDLLRLRGGAADVHNKKRGTLVMLRHGQSLWNQENRFTGWMDVPLADQGVEDAHRAAELLRDVGFTFDVAFTSVLQRAIKTMHVILEDLGISWIPTHCRWRLNERHDGVLAGLNKKMAVQQYGEAAIKKWRRGYADTPPPLNHSHPCWPGHDSKYAHMGFKGHELPLTESLKDTLDRALPCWEEIAALLREGKNVLVVTHGNVVRALAKMLDMLSDDVIMDIDIPSCCPMAYHFRCADLIPVMTPKSWAPLSAEFRGDQEEVRKLMNKVKAETKTQMWARDVRQLLKRNNWAGPEEPTELEQLWRPLGTMSIGTHLWRTKLRPWSWMKGARGRPARTPMGHNRLPVKAPAAGHVDAVCPRNGSFAGKDGPRREEPHAMLPSTSPVSPPPRGASRGHSCEAGVEARRRVSRVSPDKRGHDRLPVKVHAEPAAGRPH